MKYRNTALFVILMMIAIASIAQEKRHTWLGRSDFYRPFISEIRSSITKIEFGYLNDLGSNYWLTDYQSRPFAEVHFGFEIPVIVYRSQSYKPNQPFGVSLSLPVAAVVLVDMLEVNTAPVVNADYWFCAEIRAVWYPDFIKKIGINNLGFKFIPISHESTHIGDEVSIHGYQTIQEFERINVSYEAWELGITLNDPDTLQGNVLSFRTGVMGIWWLNEGYYTIDSLEVKDQDVQKSSNRPEYYFALNWIRRKGWATNKKWNNEISLEVRNRIKFSYQEGAEENRSWNFNSYLGWKYNMSGNYMGTMGLYARFYYGINPHGQFRDIGNFRFIGLSLILR